MALGCGVLPTPHIPHPPQLPSLSHLSLGGTLTDTRPCPLAARGGGSGPATASPAGLDGGPPSALPKAASHPPRQTGESRRDLTRNRAPRPRSEWQSRGSGWRRQGHRMGRWFGLKFCLSLFLTAQRWEAPLPPLGPQFCPEF